MTFVGKPENNSRELFNDGSSKEQKFLNLNVTTNLETKSSKKRHENKQAPEIN